MDVEKQYDSMIDFHKEVKEDLLLNGDTFTNDQLIILNEKLMRHWDLIKDICPSEHIDLIQNILLIIGKLRSLE